MDDLEDERLEHLANGNIGVGAELQQVVTEFGPVDGENRNYIFFGDRMSLVLFCVYMLINVQIVFFKEG